jgi:hypothetical protein
MIKFRDYTFDESKIFCITPIAQRKDEIFFKVYSAQNELVENIVDVYECMDLENLIYAETNEIIYSNLKLKGKLFCGELKNTDIKQYVDFIKDWRQFVSDYEKTQNF